ncbi:prion-inhibition and propagation-domain-containing protein [Corynascus similis CBS 632.67]
MEPVSLSIGLVGLIDPLIQLTSIVKTYRSFTPDSDALNAQFEAERLRFERWKRSVGSDTQLSADQQTRSVVENLLSVIDNIIEAKESIHQTGKTKSRPANNAIFDTRDQHHAREDAGSKRHKLTWALGRKRDLTDLVTRFGKVVQQVHDLVPPNQVASTRSSTENKRLETLQGSDLQGNAPWPGKGLEHGFLVELHQIMTELRQGLEKAQADTRREIHSWLLGQNSPNERYSDLCDVRLTDTCDWVLTLPAFSQWSALDLPSGAPEILWIYGPPGFGKTILSSRIVEHLLTVHNKPVAYFFFSSDHESRNDPYIVVRSWVSQLASQPEVFALACQRWLTTQDQVASRATITQLLHEALRVRPDCYLVVDGLDECTAAIDSSNSVARFLKDVKKAITPSTRVLVVSREEHEIRQALRIDGSKHLAEYRISPDDVQADATAFARSIVDRKLPKKSEHDKASLSQTMTARCEGQFLWLKMQEQNLKAWKNLGQLQRALEGTPTELDHIYKRNWDRIERSDRAVALLRWAAFALRPLTVDEIVEAVLIDEDCEDLPTNELPDAIDDDYIGTEILELCAPLLEVRGSHLAPAVGSRTLHLTHFTVREFLVKRLPAGAIWQNENLRASNEYMQHHIGEGMSLVCSI